MTFRAGQITLFLWTLLCIAFVFVLAASSLYISDDTFIAFRYAKNWYQYGALTWNPGLEMVDGFTSFLHVAILYVGYKLGLEALDVQSYTAILSIIIIFAVFVRMCGVLHVKRPLIFLGIASLALYKPIAWYASAGFETLQYTSLLGMLILYYSLWLKYSDKNRYGYAACALLCILNFMRPETFAYTALMLGWMLVHKVKSRALDLAFIIWVGVYGISALAYLGLRTLTYGYPVPNTYFAKNAGGRIGRILNGADYFADSLLWGGGAMVVASLVFVIRRPADKPVMFLSLFSIGFVLLFTVAGGDNHHGFRFFVPVMPYLILLTIYYISHGITWQKYLSIVLIFWLMVSQYIGTISQRDYYRKWQTDFTKLSQQLEEGWGNIKSARWPITDQNFSSARRLAGTTLQEVFPMEYRFMIGDVGQIGFYTDHVIYDTFGLNDREIAHLPSENFGRWHTYGKYSPKRIIDSRKVDVVLTEVASQNQPVRDWNALDTKPYYQSLEFLKRYQQMNIPVPESDRFVWCYLDKSLPLRALRTEYFSIIHFINDLYRGECTIYYEQPDYQDLFFAQLQQSGRITDSAENADIIIADREDALSKRIASNKNYSLIPQVSNHRNRWLSCYVNLKTIPTLSRPSQGEMFQFVPLPELHPEQVADSRIKINGELFSVASIALKSITENDRIQPVLVLPIYGFGSQDIELISTSTSFSVPVKGIMPTFRLGENMSGSDLIAFGQHHFFYYNYFACQKRSKTIQSTFNYNDNPDFLCFEMESVRSSGAPLPTTIEITLNGKTQTIQISEKSWVKTRLKSQLGENRLTIVTPDLGANEVIRIFNYRIGG